MEVIKHHFLSGVYLKEFTLAEGEAIRQHRHNFDHATLLAEGCVIMTANNERTIHFAPAVILVKHGDSHGFEAFDGPARLFCVHVTTHTDPDTIDEELIVERID